VLFIPLGLHIVKLFNIMIGYHNKYYPMFSLSIPWVVPAMPGYSSYAVCNRGREAPGGKGGGGVTNNVMSLKYSPAPKGVLDEAN